MASDRLPLNLPPRGTAPAKPRTRKEHAHVYGAVRVMRARGHAVQRISDRTALIDGEPVDNAELIRRSRQISTT